ncbi:MAG: SprT family zinc-dependent metalloprotease [Ruminococcaceae bacterium]|nr:SprT family zinc-dependent metalloprotease [Oscillospiraceae bacterium]
MSTITKKWDEKKIRDIIRALDEKTGLNGAAYPIRLTEYQSDVLSCLGCFMAVGKNKGFKFAIDYFNDPFTKEAEVIDIIRHEYAHYYTDTVQLYRYINYSHSERSHGDAWKWACIMVGAEPKRYHDVESFKDKNWSIDEAKAAYRADDVPEFNIRRAIRFGGSLTTNAKKLSWILLNDKMG